MSTNFIADAPEPSRSTGTITLAWGLLNIPLSIYTGTEDTHVGRKEFIDGDTSRPAGRAVIDKTSGEVVEQSRVVRMAEASDGSYVVLTDDEIAACTGHRNVAEVVAFISTDDIMNYVPNKLMQARPKKDKGVPNPAAAQAFSLLVSAMANRKVAALVKVALRGPAQYAILTATGDLIFVCYSDGVRKPLNMGLVLVTPEAVDMAHQLIDAIGVAQAPHIPDVTAQAVGQFVDQKSGGVIHNMQAEPKATNAVDIMSQLMKSIDEKKNAPKWGAPTGVPLSIPAPA